jgi:hypothetical protein
VLGVYITPLSDAGTIDCTEDYRKIKYLTDVYSKIIK